MTWSVFGQGSRGLTIKLDTLDLNVCGAKTFTMPLSIGDIPVSDSLYAVTVTLSWDVTTLELEDFVLAGSNTLAGGLSRQPLVVRDRTQGILYIELGTDPSAAPIAGSGKPMLFLRGTVISPDTVAGLLGWIDISSASFVANVDYNPLEKRPGRVQVYRDTSEAFTGQISVSDGAFDTLRYDTVDVTFDNLSAHRVRSIDFTLVADTTRFAFVDTISDGTLSESSSWSKRTVMIHADTLRVAYESAADIAANGVFIRLVLERRLLLGFESPIEIPEFFVNLGSCLGRLRRNGGVVTANAIPVSGVDRSARPIAPDIDVSGGQIVVSGVSAERATIALFDSRGDAIAITQPGLVGPGALSVNTMVSLPQGVYFVVVRDRNRFYYKQFIANR